MIRIVFDRIKRVGLRKTLSLALSRLKFALFNLQDVQLRRCKCCGSVSLFLRLGRSVEGIRCIRCGANYRYELLAIAILEMSEIFRQAKLIVEFDPNSPLKRVLGRYSDHYVRTFFHAETERGSEKAGAICQDLQKLTWSDRSIDIMISSDVLEHVPEFEQALAEMRRVLTPGGFHLFTVPMQSKTIRRARISNGDVEYIKPPTYHLDPLNPVGALVFWDFGLDFEDIFSRNGLNLECVAQDRHGYRVWRASICQ